MTAQDPSRPTIAFAGGGTGGHIYPNVGIAQALVKRAPGAAVSFVVSDRPGDAKTMGALGYDWIASGARPLPNLRKPTTAVPFLSGWTRGSVQAISAFRRAKVSAVVATGGFVSGPAVVAARMLGIPAVMVNLDAIPGASNRAMVRLCRKVFTAYASDLLPGAEVVGLPLRDASVGETSPEAARTALGLDPKRHTLMITGATHGAESIINAMMALLSDDATLVRALDGWQVLHQCGTFDVGTLQRAYDDAGVTARAVDYLPTMGAAYAAADLVVSRSGAGSVAEAWANGCPTVFLPNPYHSDQHQRHNALPMVNAGGAVLVTDHVDAAANVKELGPALTRRLQDAALRKTMRHAAMTSRPPDGAAAVAQWLLANLP